MNIPLRWFPQEIIDQYKIMDLVYKYGFVYVDIRKDMYVLKQAAFIASDRIVKLLKSHDYYPLRSNPGIWCHKTLPTKLTLRVENLGIKYANPAHYHHIVNTVQKYYKISIDWERKNYFGLNLD